MTKIPKSHPRYASLITREQVIEGVKTGLTSIQGLIAQGRGEAFDYLLGERTTTSADKATKVAAAMLLLARQPVLSVNGNVAALVPKEMVTLSNELKAPLEVNLFHRTEERVTKISKLLRDFGAEKVLGETQDTILPGLDHSRSKATRGGILNADVVLIPLEDGDRCEVLVKMAKKVIAIDLNPLSRTARMATLTIVDNIVRATPNLIASVRELSGSSTDKLQDVLLGYNNNFILQQAIEEIRKNLDRQIETPVQLEFDNNLF
ncbi:MAG: phosphopantothenate/pantothenate synthetase [Methanotrichaceae archaeon]|nr:phosphopantothenate/pantothenate synthetase [Methanotrichaceae archaeon]